ncbi:MAG: GNAT family N-acetyltransferase [Caulobacterales bacterium]
MTGPKELEPIAARAWRAGEEAALGGWRLYASAGFSGRINACWPLAAPDRPLAEAIAAVEAWYAARGLKPIFKIVPAAEEPAGLTAALAAGGYRPRTRTLMMTGPVAGEADATVRVASELDAAFEAVFAAAGTGDPGDTRERLEALGRIVPPRGFARIDVEGAPAAIGAAAVEGEWAGIFGMRTDPAYRRRGLARAVLASLLAFARGAGARRAYLQVEADNASAIALYGSAGFETVYSYQYWDRR